MSASTIGHLSRKQSTGEAGVWPRGSHIGARAARSSESRAGAGPGMLGAVSALGRSKRTSASRKAAGAGACAPARRRRAPADVRDFAGLFKALSDPTRLAILALLAAGESERCACEIEEHCGLAQATVSHHLRLLKAAGFLSCERRGTWVYYRLETRALARLDRFRSLLA